MYKRMLVLLDGSELSEVVFKYAQVLSGRLGMDLELLHVASPSEADQMPMRQAYMEHTAARLCAQAEEIRAAAGAEALGECILARGTVAVGDPAEEILEYLDQNDIDLVMMTTRGRSGFRGFALGSVANKVVHASKVPVWLVPVELREEIVTDALPGRTIVIPLDGSKTCEAAIPHALSVASQRGAKSEFLLLNVQEMPTTVYSRSHAEQIEDDRRQMEEYLEAVARPLREAGHTARVEVLMGNPARSIIDYIRDNPVQLIAMATCSKSGISRMIFGSVTESVLQMIKKTPMLLVSGAEEN